MDVTRPQPGPTVAQSQADLDATELRELRWFLDLSVEVWLEMTGGDEPAVGDEWGQYCQQAAKASGRLPLTDRDLEWDA